MCLSSPIIITLDSDSSHDNHDINNHSSSSSPLSSQQTVDFCDLPPLPLMPSAGVGGALNAEIGELPADILDQGSDGSETELAGPAAGTIAVDNSDNSDGEVDVENVEESSLRTRAAEEKGPKKGRGEGTETSTETRTVRDDDATSTGVNCGAPRTQTEDLPLDSHLLATILNDLKGISAPGFEPSTSLGVGRTRSWDPPDKEDLLSKKRQPECSENLNKTIRDQNNGSSSLPLLERQRDAGVQHETRDVPPLLKKASPIQTHNRNTPPPLKHKDAGSPHLLPIPSIDLQTSGELPGDNLVIPPISTLKRHFNSSLGGSTSHLASTSNSLTTDFHSEVGASAAHSKRDKPYICSPTGSQIRAHFPPNADFSSFYPSDSREVPVGRRVPSIDFPPLHTLPPIDFQLKAGWSKEKPAYTHSTSRGCQVAPVILHPSSRGSGERTPAGDDVFSGTKCNETSRPVCDSRTQNPALSIDSYSQKLPPSGENSMPTTEASDKPALFDVHSGAPKCSVEFRFLNEASEVPMDAASSYNRRSPSINLNFPAPDKQTNDIFSPTVNEHLNHMPYASTTFLTQHRKQGSLSTPAINPHSDSHHSDSKAFNHTDETSNPQVCSQSWSEQNPTNDSHAKPRPSIDSHPQSLPILKYNPKPEPTIDSHPQSLQTIDPHPKPQPTVDSHPHSQQSIDSHLQSQPTINSHSKTPLLHFQNSTDNHVSINRQSVENYHNSHSSFDSHSNSESPVDECSASSFWKTHTRLK